MRMSLPGGTTREPGVLAVGTVAALTLEVPMRMNASCVPVFAIRRELPITSPALFVGKACATVDVVPTAVFLKLP